MTDAAVIQVGGAYDVVVGHGVIDRVADLLGPSVRQVLVVRPAPLVQLVQPVVDRLRAAGLMVHEATVPDTESAKTAAWTTRLWTQLSGRFQCDRASWCGRYSRSAERSPASHKADTVAKTPL